MSVAWAFVASHLVNFAKFSVGIPESEK
jgi:hypothetical protein